MNVLAISPGISKLVYTVLEYRKREPCAVILDSSVLTHQTLRKFSTSGLPALIERASVHWLLLSVCVERYAPSLVVLGPGTKKEQSDYVEACRRVLRTSLLAASIPMIEYTDESQICSDIGCSHRELRAVMEREVTGIPSQRLFRQTICSGIAGAHQMMDLLPGRVSRAT